jgi:hypothetical protein
MLEMKSHPPAISLLAILLLSATPAPSPTPGPCSHDVFGIDGRSVNVELCADDAGAHRSPDGHRIIVTIGESFSAPPSSFERNVTLDFLAGAELSRTIDDVPLDKLGIDRTRHLTIGSRPGSVRLEHALLVPGAIALK